MAIPLKAGEAKLWGRKEHCSPSTSPPQTENELPTRPQRNETARLCGARSVGSGGQLVAGLLFNNPAWGGRTCPAHLPAHLHSPREGANFLQKKPVLDSAGGRKSRKGPGGRHPPSWATEDIDESVGGPSVRKLMHFCWSIGCTRQEKKHIKCKKNTVVACNLQEFPCCTLFCRRELQIYSDFSENFFIMKLYFGTCLF